jgi:hypothetical protein
MNFPFTVRLVGFGLESHVTPFSEILLLPGLEHFGGVTRGGTFVLVQDSENKVFADFMLPYFLGAASTGEKSEGISLPSGVETEEGPGTIVVRPTGEALTAKKVSAKRRKAADKKTIPGGSG